MAVGLLELEAEPIEVQDSVLFSCFVMAVGAFFYHSTPTVAETSSIYGLTHPPQAARMNHVMKEARRYCSYNRPLLAEWMNNERFTFLMGIVAEATLGPGGSGNWASQTNFFQSEEGLEYLQQLQSSGLAHRSSL